MTLRSTSTEFEKISRPERPYCAILQRGGTAYSVPTNARSSREPTRLSTVAGRGEDPWGNAARSSCLTIIVCGLVSLAASAHAAPVLKLENILALRVNRRPR
jgi:hypothetical protein